MASTTIRIPVETFARLRDLADGQPIGGVVQRLVEEDEERRFWRRYHEQMREARADHVAWSEWEREIAVFDGALADGLDPEP